MRPFFRLSPFLALVIVAALVILWLLGVEP